MSEFSISILKNEHENLMVERNRICHIVNENFDGIACIINQAALNKIDIQRELLIDDIRSLEVKGKNAKYRKTSKDSLRTLEQNRRIKDAENQNKK